MILLDTHVLVWFVDGDPRLGSTARQIIGDAFVADDVAFAAISLWEIGMLVARQHVALTMPPTAWIERLIGDGLRIVDLTYDMALDAGTMPRDIHSEPCDRIIMATVRKLGCPLVTADRRLLEYGAGGWLHAIDARH